MRVSTILASALCLTVLPARGEVVPACEQGPVRGRYSVEIWPEQLPARDYLDAIRGCLAESMYYRFERPESAWLDSQRTAFTNALKKQRVDILVAPFQVQGYGLERTERALMSADLAYQLGGSARVADPFLVARALGEGARRYERNTILALAHELGARKVVIGYAGHDRAHNMTITLEVVELEADKPTATVHEKSQKDWRAVPFTDAEPPFAVFHRMLPTIVDGLAIASESADRKPKPARFPKDVSFSFGELAAEKPVVGASVALGLLGAMAGSTDALSRERLSERALVTSWHLDAPGDDTTFVRAYALLNLEHRPAALALLDGATEPAHVALRALLNGDVPGATAALPRVASSLQRLLLAVHVDDLQFVEGKEGGPQTADAATFGMLALDWKLLIDGRAADLDPWSTEGPAGLKYLLDAAFPVDGLGVMSVLGGSVIVGEPADDVAVSLATARHVARFVESADVPVCCTEAGVRASAWDLVGLIEGRNESQIAKSLNRTIAMQVLLERAGAQLARYSQVFDGHPLIAAANMDYAFRMAGRSGDATVQTWQRQALKDATVAAYFAGGQHRVAMRAFGVLGFSSEHGSTLLDAYGFDYPRRPFWPEWMFTVRGPSDGSHEKRIEALRREAAAYSRYDFTPFNFLMAALPHEERASLLPLLEGRFVGTKGRAHLISMTEPPRPASTDPIENTRALLASDPDNWNVRHELGRLIVERGGKYEEVAEIFLAHPPFQQASPPGRVRVSNDAYDAGNFFFWNGRDDLAPPFFEISAGFGTGSEGSITSEIRLDILAQRYRKAAAQSLARAQRYPSAYPYRDFLSFLHALGDRDAAWDGFSQVASAFDNSQVWVSALVGQRRDGLSEAEIREWLKKPGIRDAKFRASRFAPRYAVLVNASDHEPPEDLGALVAELEGEPTAWVDGEGMLARPHPLDPTGLQLVRPSSFADGASKAPEGTRVKSEFAYFGAAYAAIRHGKLEAAVDELTAMAAFYPIEASGYSYALPYLAWAAAKTGDAADFENYVMTHGGYDVRFDFFLARAFFAAVKNKDPARARELLVNSLPGHPYTDNRPLLVEYQYAEACEWLYKETGDEAFVDVLLGWVKSQQAVQPTHAWPYAMEYTYARTAERRMRALAMTLYLDPTSERIKSATATERRDAEAWGKEHNPFLRESDGESDRSAALQQAAEVETG